ncbi:MAG: peptidoglycan-binding domain-containing protein, partial [Nannocystaceae bacterium]
MPVSNDPPSSPNNTADGGQEDFHHQFFAFHGEDSNLEVDDPWHEADLDGDPHEHGDESEGPLAFGDPPELDFRSLERWLQSCLRRLVNSAMTVDGIYGRGTRRALRKFQRTYNKNHPDSEPLDVDGQPGPASVAALEECTGST